MSYRRLPRAQGTAIRCDGEGCTVESITGQVIAALHRAWLYATQGWGRGQLRATRQADPERSRGTAGLDLCPSCLARDTAAVWRRARARRGRRAA